MANINLNDYDSEQKTVGRAIEKLAVTSDENFKKKKIVAIGPKGHLPKTVSADDGTTDSYLDKKQYRQRFIYNKMTGSVDTPSGFDINLDIGSVQPKCQVKSFTFVFNAFCVYQSRYGSGSAVNSYAKPTWDRIDNESYLEDDLGKGIQGGIKTDITMTQFYDNSLNTVGFESTDINTFEAKYALPNLSPTSNRNSQINRVLTDTDFATGSYSFLDGMDELGRSNTSLDYQTFVQRIELNSNYKQDEPLQVSVNIRPYLSGDGGELLAEFLDDDVAAEAPTLDNGDPDPAYLTICVLDWSLYAESN